MRKVSNVTRPTPLMCELVGGYSGPASRHRKAARMFALSKSPSQPAGVKQGRGLTAGIYEPVPGLLDTLFVPKVAGNQGTRFKKSLVISRCQDCCKASPSWAHSRFASGYGPNRQESLLGCSERMCIQYSHSWPWPHAWKARTQQPCGSHAAQATRRIS
jgi:hypothetical protein